MDIPRPPPPIVSTTTTIHFLLTDKRMDRLGNDSIVPIADPTAYGSMGG